MKINLPKEDGAWWIATICWVCGWAATQQAAWEPLAIAGAVFLLLLAAQVLRSVRRLWEPDPRAAWRKVALLAAILLPPAGLLSWYVLRVQADHWALVPILPALLYTGAIISGSERVPINRILAIVAMTGIAPATYASVTGMMDITAMMLWATLGGYFVLGGILIMAKLRKSLPALWIVRVMSPLAAAGPILCSVVRDTGHWVLAGVFIILAIKAWVYRPSAKPVDPRRVGQAELAYSGLAMVLVIAALWFPA